MRMASKRAKPLPFDATDPSPGAGPGSPDAGGAPMMPTGVGFGPPQDADAGEGEAGEAEAPIEPTVQGLLFLLGKSFDPVGETQRWVQAGGGQGLSPDDLAAIIRAVRLGFDQPPLMRALMKGTGAITCGQVAAAVGAAADSVKAEIASVMGPSVSDPENAETTIRPTLSSFQWQVTRAAYDRAGVA